MLADTKSAYALQMHEVLEEMGDVVVADEEFIKRVGNKDQHEIFREFLQTEDERIIEQALNFYSSLYDKFVKKRRLFDNIPEILEKLSSTYKLAIVSRKDQKMIEHWIKYFGIEKFFEDVIGTLEDTKAKAITRLMAKHKLSSNSVIMIGDTTFDITSAKEAQVISILAVYGVSDEETFKSNPDYLLEDIVFLPELVKQIEKDYST